MDGEVSVAVTGAGADGVYRHADLEKALTSDWSAQSAGSVKTSDAGLMSDIHGSAEYRAHLIGAMAKRAIAG